MRLLTERNAEEASLRALEDEYRRKSEEMEQKLKQLYKERKAREEIERETERLGEEVKRINGECKGLEDANTHELGELQEEESNPKLVERESENGSGSTDG